LALSVEEDPSWRVFELRYTTGLRVNTMSDDLKGRVQELIDTMINPAVAGHGGFVELIDVRTTASICRWAAAARAAARPTSR